MTPPEETAYLARVFCASSTQESRRLYDAWATTYDSDMQMQAFTAPRLVAERVARGLELETPHRDPGMMLSEQRILDAGCGTGSVGNALAKMGAARVDGLDISSGMLEVARKSGAYAELKIADLTRTLECRDGEYDAVTCCGTFTHGYLGAGPLAEFLRVVRSGGVVVATVLDSHWAEAGFEAEVRRLEEAGLCTIVEKNLHQYRKDAGGGRILVLRSV